jgi:nitrate/TMAO reductase-like tetraheme cytochrome c subunit
LYIQENAMKFFRANPIRTSGLILGLGLVILALGWLSFPAAAAAQSRAAGLTNDECLACHNQPNVIKELGNDELLLRVEREKFSQSVHGSQGLACTDCHSDIREFPHPKYKGGTSLRGMQVAIYNATKESCAKCHSSQEEHALDSVHQRALDAGNNNAAVCADCHHPHYLDRWEDRPRTAIPETCARCHNGIFETYTGSVHGAALIGEGNPDVPTCIDCHGLHNIQDPTTAEFRNATPQLCAKCHTDAAVMDRYGLSTDVLATYVSDFHGTTAVLFEQSHPGQKIDTAVCTDCHGVHDISRVDDPQTGIGLKTNLLKRCQACHPDATDNFPDAWMSHYIPDQQKYPIVYFVDLFYKVMIPAVIGGMLVFVVSDFVRRLIERGKSKKGGAH